MDASTRGQQRRLDEIYREQGPSDSTATTTAEVGCEAFQLIAINHFKCMAHELRTQLEIMTDKSYVCIICYACTAWQCFVLIIIYKLYFLLL